MELKYQVNYKALLQGVLVYLLLYFIQILLLPILTKAAQSGGELFAWLKQLVGLATVVVSGIIAGKLAGEKGFLYGGLVGVFGTLVSALAAVLWAAVTSAPYPMLATLPFWLTVNGFLAAFSGMVATSESEDEGKTPSKDRSSP